MQSDTFQEDIYPDTLSGDPSLTSAEWFSGHDAPPRVLKMELVYRGTCRGDSSRRREFAPLDPSEPELKLKIAPQADILPKTTSEAVPPANKPTQVEVAEVRLSEKSKIAVAKPDVEPPSTPDSRAPLPTVNRINFRRI